MTSVGPDLLLPGVASKKPAPASDGEAKSPSHEGGVDTGFAQELDAVMTPAPTPMTLQQQPPVEGIAPAAVDELASLMTVQEAPAEGLPLAINPATPATEITAAAATPPGSNVAAGKVNDRPAANGAALLVAEAIGEETIVENNLAPQARDAAGTVIVPTPEPTPLVSQTAAGTPDGNHLLATVAGVNGISGPGLMGQGQSASAAPSTPSQTSPNQGPNPTVLAASLAVDPRALPSGNPDGHQNSHLPNNDKAALRTAASLTTDSKPNDPAGGQSFSNTLNAAATETAGQSARGAAQAAAQRPARPAQTAPPTAQIAVHIVRAVGDGISRFNVQLQPAELGRVEVKLEVNREGAVRAMVTAERQETVDQLQRDSRALERALQDAGLKTDSQNLQFSLRGGQNGRGLSENRTSIGNSGDADIAEVSESALAAHWSNVAGSTGALDIRV